MRWVKLLDPVVLIFPEIDWGIEETKSHFYEQRSIAEMDSKMSNLLMELFTKSRCMLALNPGTESIPMDH